MAHRRSWSDAGPISNRKEEEQEEEEEEADPRLLAQGAELRDAAFAGDTTLLAKLLHQGYNLNQCDSAGFTALHAAAVTGKASVVRFLLRHDGVDINVTDDAGDTPLLYATLRGHVEVVEELAKAGADLTIRGQDGCHAGQLAERAGHVDIARFFRGRGLIGDMDFSQGTALEGVLQVADGSSADKWQTRAFICSRLHKGLFFWAGSRVDILGVVAQIPFHAVRRVNGYAGGNPRRFNVVALTGRVLPVLAADEAEMKEWVATLSILTRKHVAAYAVQSILRVAVAKARAARIRRHRAAFFRTMTYQAGQLGGDLKVFDPKKRFGITTTRWRKRYMLLIRRTVSLKLYASKSQFDARSAPSQVIKLQDLARLDVDEAGLIVALRLWCGTNTMLKFEYIEDLHKWVTSLQSTLVTLGVSATLFQAAWRRFVCVHDFPYVRREVFAGRLSEELGVPLEVLDETATRIKRAWRNAVWALVTSKSIFRVQRPHRASLRSTPSTRSEEGPGVSKLSRPSIVANGSSSDASSVPVSPPPSAHGNTSPASSDDKRRKASLMSVASTLPSRPPSPRSAASAAPPLFADADDWFAQHLRAMDLPLTPPGDRADTLDPSQLDKMIELMKLDFLRRMASTVPHAPAEAASGGGSPVAGAGAAAVSGIRRNRSRSDLSEELGMESPEKLLALSVPEVLRRWVKWTTGREVHVRPVLPAMPNLRARSSVSGPSPTSGMERRKTVGVVPPMSSPKPKRGLFGIFKRNRASSRSSLEDGETKSSPPPMEAVAPPSPPPIITPGQQKIESWGGTGQTTVLNRRNAAAWASRLATGHVPVAGSKAAGEWAMKRLYGRRASMTPAPPERHAAVSPGRREHSTSVDQVYTGVKESDNEEEEEEEEEDEEEEAGGTSAGGWETVMKDGAVTYTNKATGEVSTVAPWLRA